MIGATPTVPRKPPEDHLRRLSAAVEAFWQHRRAGADDAALLARHPELRDLLEPMLQGEVEAAPDGPPPAAPGDGGGLPRSFGDFDLRRELGRGGMGIVYEAVERPLGRRVALKVLRADYGQSPRQVERFRREASAAARLNHRDIAAVHRVGAQDGVHFIAMQLVEGVPLAIALDRVRAAVGEQPPGSEQTLGSGLGRGYLRECAEVCARIADALQYAHDHGVLHRDVKPHNVLLSGDGQVTLVDFGLAKDLDADPLSRTGELAGTPQYMSPEQTARGGAVVDHRTDVYSLGVVLYELITLCCPFDGPTTHAILADIAVREPRPLRRHNPAVPIDLETVCRVAMDKDAARRYQTAGELAADLRRFARGEPVAARAPGVATRALRWSRRHRAASVAGVLAFLLVVIAPALFGLREWRSRRALADEQARTAAQRDVARTALHRARDAIAELFGVFVDDDVAPLPQLEQLRRTLLERAIPYDEAFLQLAPDDPYLRRGAAESHLRLGNALEQLGRFEPAAAHLDSCIEQVVALRGESDGPRLRQLHARALRLSARVAARVGPVDRAARDRAAAVELLAGLVDDADATVAGPAAIALSALLVERAREDMLRRGALQSADADLQRAAALWPALPPAVRDAAVHRAARGELHRQRGRLEMMRGDLRAADECFSQAEDLVAAALDDEPRHAGRRRLAGDLGNLRGQVLDQLGEPAAARACFSAATAAYRDLVREFPDTMAFRHQLGLLLHSSGMFCARQQEWPVAERHLVEALAVVEELVARAPRALAGQSLLSGVLDLLSAVRQELPDHDPQQVEAGFRRALAVLEPLLAERPQLVPLRENLANTLSNLGWFALRRGDLDAARAHLDRAVEAIATVRAALPKDGQVAEAAARIDDRLAALVRAEQEVR